MIYRGRHGSFTHFHGRIRPLPFGLRSSSSTEYSPPLQCTCTKFPLLIRTLVLLHEKLFKTRADRNHLRPSKHVGSDWILEIRNVSHYRRRFYPRDAMLARVYATAFPSVCLSHKCFVSKQLNVSSKFFYHLITPSSRFFVTDGRCLTPTASPLTGAPNTRG